MAKGVLFVFLAGPFDIILLMTVVAFFFKMCFGEQEKKPANKSSPHFMVDFIKFKGGSDTSEPN